METSAEKQKPSEFTRFVVADKAGECFKVTEANFERCPVFKDDDPGAERLRQFVTNELVGRAGSDVATPRHIEYMRRHELVDYCPVSEKGHYKWYPKGLLIQRLLVDYAAQLARDWGAFEMRNPLIIRGDNNLVGQLMGEFHERDYRVDGGRGVCYLRYASDPGAFPFMQNVAFTYKQAPLKVYEEALCFRNELEGEVSGLKRVRSFVMTDMHAACATVEQARAEFELLCMNFAELMDKVIARGRWALGWEATEAFFETHKQWLLSLCAQMGVPAFFKLMPQMSHYYAIKNEYQFLTEDKANIQVSTVQWDVKDGERFNIGYTDDTGAKQPCPVVIHASSFGSIERTLCAILENIAIDESNGVAPMFPYWLAPTQARLVPVSDHYTPLAIELCARLTASQIRADVDDSSETVGKKIRNGEKEWIPYLLIVGEKEAASGRVSVRSRRDKRSEEVELEALVDRLRAQQAEMPFRPLPLPVRVSERPRFVG